MIAHSHDLPRFNRAADRGAVEHPAARAPAQPHSERDELILSHLGLVRVIVSRLCRRLPSHVDGEELASVGLIGLIDAVDRFDPSRGTPFKAYAEIRVRGAIIDSLRQSDWVPLVVRRKRARLDRTREALRRAHGSEPDRAQMADALGISPEAYDELVGSTVVQKLVSLDEQDSGDQGNRVADRIPNGEPQLLDCWVQAEAKEALGVAIRQLPPMERQVLHMYYSEGLKYREIGRTLGVCESRICQLRGQAVERLRKAVASAAE